MQKMQPSDTDTREAAFHTGRLREGDTVVAYHTKYVAYFGKAHNCPLLPDKDEFTRIDRFCQPKKRTFIIYLKLKFVFSEHSIFKRDLKSPFCTKWANFYHIA